MYRQHLLPPSLILTCLTEAPKSPVPGFVLLLVHLGSAFLDSSSGLFYFLPDTFPAFLVVCSPLTPNPLFRSCVLPPQIRFRRAEELFYGGVSARYTLQIPRPLLSSRVLSCFLPICYDQNINHHPPTFFYSHQQLLSFTSRMINSLLQDNFYTLLLILSS